MNDVIINKIQSIQRCVFRAREEYSKSPDTFESDYTQQDATLLNILRACETTIDLANHLIKHHKMGVPTASANCFELLHRGGVIDANMAASLKRMVSFRNTAIHQYDNLDIDIVKDVILHRMNDLIIFTDIVIKYEEVQVP